MRAQARAYVAHRTLTRIRIKLAKAQGRGADVVRVKRHLLEHPDVLAVQLNPVTASLIIECRRGFELTAGHRQLLGLGIREPTNARPAYRCLGSAAPHHEINGMSGILMLSHVVKLIVAISTRQIGPQLIEWVLAGVIQAATDEAQRRAADHKSLLAISVR